MARASGNAAEGLIPGSFFHQASGIDYGLFLRDGEAWLSFDRPRAAGVDALHGEQRLLYYIGSGNRGRTYLFQNNGFWFESPVNWYARKQLWDMNPKSLDAREMPFTLQVDSTCLHCHSSGVAASLPGSRNHFAAKPFAHGGITCASCHGDASAHLAQGGRGPILNPAKLTGSRRDSVCLQCHLEGETAVNQPRRSLRDFTPGDDLAEDVRFFIHQGEIGAEGRATSQWEALLQSACYRKSSGRMSCSTCHDPHSVPAPADRVQYFRRQCIQCHASAAFVAQHHPEQPDCSSCHMAREKTEDIAHEQVTDHFIQKRPLDWLPALMPRGDALVAVGGAAASDRDLGLAYAQLAIKGDAQAALKARDLLQQAERKSKSTEALTEDTELHAKLGFIDLLSQDPAAAAKEYQMALSMHPEDGIAAADLALLRARTHDMTAAAQLWQTVAKDDPGQTAAGYNLAVAECMLGDRAAAQAALQRVIAFSPDDRKVKALLLDLQRSPKLCVTGA